MCEEEAFNRTLDRGIELFNDGNATSSAPALKVLRRFRFQALRHLRVSARPHRADGSRTGVERGCRGVR